jgi:hypothetical protein
MPEFWKSSGIHLLQRNAQGWLEVTPDYVRAYLTRPEVHPIDTSCAAEIALFEELMADPFLAVPPERLAGLADKDAAESYRIVLAFRDILAEARTVEGAYLSIIGQPNLRLPPVFIDQMVHVIACNMLRECRDPIRPRAAELLFREQNVSTEDGRIMLADEEIVEMHARTGATGLAQLIQEAGTALKAVSLDVLDEDNKQLYWARSDRFDTVVDFRFTEPANDAFARVVEAWVAHFTGHKVRVQPKERIEDQHWRWHIGLDREATAILNALYEGRDVGLADIGRIIGLFSLTFEDERAVIDAVRGLPVHLGLAMSPAKRLKVKPQNLLTNLPLRKAD